MTVDFLSPAARATDPDTSHDAAASMEIPAAFQRWRIWDCLRTHGPLGKDGIARHTGLTGVAVARRLTELGRTNKARPTGKRVVSDAGRTEREWEAVAETRSAS